MGSSLPLVIRKEPLGIGDVRLAQLSHVGLFKRCLHSIKVRSVLATMRGSECCVKVVSDELEFCFSIKACTDEGHAQGFSEVVALPCEIEVIELVAPALRSSLSKSKRRDYVLALMELLAV